MNGAEQLVLVPDRAVGDEHHLPHLVGVLLVAIHQRRLQRGQHLRPAIRLQRRHKALRSRDVLLARRNSGGEQHVHRVVEPDDVELIRRRQPIKRQQKPHLRLVHALARHRAGIVDHEDRLAIAPLSLNLHRRRVHHGEKIVLAIACLTEQPGRRCRGGFRLPAQHKVPVGRNLAILQRNVRGVPIHPRHDEAVRLR